MRKEGSSSPSVINRGKTQDFCRQITACKALRIALPISELFELVWPGLGGRIVLQTASHGNGPFDLWTWLAAVRIAVMGGLARWMIVRDAGEEVYCCRY
jgi:hypothetical protein